MSLSVLNLYYFLVGVFVFLLMKYIVRFDYFEKENLISHKIAKVVHIFLGLVCIIAGVNGIFSLIQIKTVTNVLDYRHILPIILLFISAVIFLSDSFKDPSKNYLIALGIGVLISSIGFLITLIIGLLGPENVFGTHILYINYILLVPFALATLIGILVGVWIYYSYLRRKRPTWNDSLWDKSRLWSIINNQYSLLALSIIMFFEIWFQWHSTSMVSLLIQIM